MFQLQDVRMQALKLAPWIHWSRFKFGEVQSPQVVHFELVMTYLVQSHAVLIQLLKSLSGIHNLPKNGLVQSPHVLQALFSIISVLQSHEENRH